MTTTGTPAILGGAPSMAAPVVDSPAKVKEAAVQFESLLISQLLRSAREGSGGWLGSGEDQSGSSLSDYSEQQMAQVLSANGGLGLASLIEMGLVRASTPSVK